MAAKKKHARPAGAGEILQNAKKKTFTAGLATTTEIPKKSLKLPGVLAGKSKNFPDFGEAAKKKHSRALGLGAGQSRNAKNDFSHRPAKKNMHGRPDFWRA